VAQSGHVLSPFRRRIVHEVVAVSALDKWSISLRCPHCARIGTATISEDGSTQRINDISSGFMLVERRAPGAGHDIRCSTCNSSALQ
jgi:phage FluMu protein Com